MEETTHDSSSNSRKSEEKCPPAGGIKMKNWWLQDRPTVTTNHQMQQSNWNPVGLTVGFWFATAKPG